MLLNNILPITKGGEITNITKKIKKLLVWQKRLKNNLKFIKNNSLSAVILLIKIDILFFS